MVDLNLAERVLDAISKHGDAISLGLLAGSTVVATGVGLCQELTERYGSPREAYRHAVRTVKTYLSETPRPPHLGFFD